MKRELCRGRSRSEGGTTGSAISGPGVKGGSVAGVMTRAFAWEELAVDDFLEQRVVEGVVRIRRTPGRDQDAPVDDLTKRLAHDRCRQVGDRDEQFVVDPGARGGGHTEDLLACLGNGRDTGEHDIPQAGWQLAATGLPRHREHLLRVERVPSGPFQRAVHELGIW